MQFKFDDANFFDYILIYLGVSIGSHAFPSTGDAQTLWESVMKSDEHSLLTKIFVAPIVGFIYLGALGSFFWLDFAYGFAISMGLPYIILKCIV